jgi:fructose-bisphosphate aldolase, class II
MPLVSPKQMFERAYAEGFAVGAFNVNNMEIIQGIISAGEEERSPLILQVSAGARKYAGQTYLIKLIEAALEESDLPICLHLDHGQDFEICKAVIDGGFTSVMIDGSHLPFEENIELTRKVVEYAHDRGIWVEGELGRLAGVEDEVSSDVIVYTDPEEAAEFVERSGCDSLAVAIGTSHGAYKFKGEARLDFDRLDRIKALLPGYPIVLHGASSVLPEFVEMSNRYGGKIAGAKGVPEDLLRRAAASAVCKINIDTDIRLAMTAVIRKYLSDNPGEFDPRKYLGESREAVREMVGHKIRTVLGSSGKI